MLILTTAKRLLATIIAGSIVLTPVNISAEEIKPIPATKHYDQKQIRCLTENMYFEAGNQSERGMIAVTNVVFNRIKDKRFPKTPCAVIHQKNHKTCQFSWTCKRHKSIQDPEVFERAKKLADLAVRGELRDVTHGAKFYHATYVRPGWKMTRVTQIGAHIFYNG